MSVAKSIALFLLAGLAGIGGAWLVWQGVREHRGWLWIGGGVLALGRYGFVATLQPEAHFGRILAAYGGVFVAGSLAWGMVVDGYRPGPLRGPGRPPVPGRGRRHHVRAPELTPASRHSSTTRSRGNPRVRRAVALRLARMGRQGGGTPGHVEWGCEVRDFEIDDARASGPPLVWSGPVEGPVVLVLDPAGEAKHDELPATWRPLAEHLHVVWCRLPAEVGDEPTPEDVLTALTQRSARVHVVVSGAAAQEALRLSLDHAAAVRTVTAIDPAPPQDTDPEVSPHTATEWWDRGTALLRQRLADRRVRVRCFMSRDKDTAARVDRPIPLGHPDVVGRLIETLLSFERPPASEEDSTGHLPAVPIEAQHRREVADAWREVREHVAEPMRRARGHSGQ